MINRKFYVLTLSKIHNIYNIRSVLKLATILRNTLLMKLIENNTTRRKDLVLLRV